MGEKESTDLIRDSGELNRASERWQGCLRPGHSYGCACTTETLQSMILMMTKFGILVASTTITLKGTTMHSEL